MNGVRWTRLSDECLFQAILPFAPAEEGERGKEGRRGKSRDRQIVVIIIIIIIIPSKIRTTKLYKSVSLCQGDVKSKSRVIK